MVRKEVKASSSDANKLKKNKRTSVAVMVLTPLLVLALCLSIMTLVSYKKFIELQGYAAIAFNENAHLKNPSEDNKYRNADALPMKGLTKVTVPDSDKKTEQQVRIMQNVWRKEFQCHGCIIKDGTNIILNIGLITALIKTIQDWLG